MKRVKQKAIASAAGLSPEALSNILNGRRRPSKTVSGKLEETTGISAVYWSKGLVDHGFLYKHYKFSDSLNNK